MTDPVKMVFCPAKEGKMFRRIIVLAALAVAGCATQASVSGMVVKQQEQAAVTATALRQAVAIEAVSGGEPTNPLWMSKVGNPQFKQALERSLTLNQMMAPKPEQARYRVRANLARLSQPVIGIDMTVTASVTYVVIDNATNAERARKTVYSSYTAKFSEAFLGVERLRVASEGAIRVNIATFLKWLPVALR